MNEMKKLPRRSKKKENRYWNCERICAPTRRRQTRTGSTTLDHQLPGAAAQREPAEPEQHDRPPKLQGEHAQKPEAVVLAEPHVDRHLHDRRERQRVRDVGE